MGLGLFVLVGHGCSFGGWLRVVHPWFGGSTQRCCVRSCVVCHSVVNVCGVQFRGRRVFAE